MPVRYRRLVLGVGTADPDLVSAVLWERGTLGIEQRDRSVIAYFGEGAPWREVDWSRYGARLLASETLEERDWLAAYRERVQPLAVGARLIVDPREPQPGQKPRSAGTDRAGRERQLLRLPARTAFGTGSHPSTRLVVELLEEIELEGLSVLDVGAGSGILSFAARLFGAARVVGIEVDLGAALVAAQNRRLNGIFPSFVAGGPGALASVSSFDLALVNVLPEHIADDLGAIRGLLRSGGSAIFSGILSDSMPVVRARLARAGFMPARERASAGWSALSTRVGGG